MPKQRLEFRTGKFPSDPLAESKCCSTMSVIKKLNYFRFARNYLCNADLLLQHIQIADE